MGLTASKWQADGDGHDSMAIINLSNGRDDGRYLLVIHVLVWW